MSWILAIFASLLPLYVVRIAPVVGGVRIPTTALELAFFVLCAVWVGSKWRGLGAQSLGGLARSVWASVAALREWRWPIGLFVLGSVIGVVIAEDRVGAFGLWRAYVLEPLVLFVIARDVLRAGGELAKKRLIDGFGVSLALIGLTAVYQKITGYGIPAVWQPEDVRRVTSIYGFPNAIGLFAAPIVLLVLARGVGMLHDVRVALTDRAWWLRVARALPYFASALLGILACLFAESEGALFGMAAGIAVLGLMFPKLRVATLLGIIFSCLLVMLWPELRGYVSVAVTLRDGGGYIRAFIWTDTWKMLLANPLLGVGLGNYPVGFAPFRTRTWIEIFQYPHNILLNFWSEIGVIGVVGFGWIMAKKLREMILTTVKNGAAKELWVRAGVVAAMATILVHGLVDVPYFKNDLAMLFWLIIAL